ncbi:MAG: phosphate transport regulator [Cenarchaeum symbiont of Oopsacas minuta]|nr:phosphate transport regulator [Cenarchaeum symbiont of Oopsacas minuta]
MYSGELEDQAKRKAIAMLQDEINRILYSARELAKLPDLISKKDKKGVKVCLEHISEIEEEVESLRRKITREVADVGGLILNRENLLNTAYTMDEVAGYITGISFKISNIKITTFKNTEFYDNVTVLINLVVDEIQKLNEIVRILNTDVTKAIEFAQETQNIEREIDTKYRIATIKALEEITNTKEILLVKDVIDAIEEMADKCQKVSDTFIMLALSL